MTVDDAILINLFRTRLYFPVILLGIVLLLAPGVRKQIVSTLASFQKLCRWQLVLLMAVIAFAAGAQTLYDGKSWGGDYSQYFAQARALATDTVPVWLEKNLFIINTSTEGIGSDVYPWGWAILLAPVYTLFGFNIPILKCYELFFFAAAIAFLTLYLRNRLNGGLTFLISLAVIFSLDYLMDINTIESDIPFMMVIFLTLLLIDRYRTAMHMAAGYKLPIYGAAVGVCMFLCSETRTMGLAVPVALAVTELYWLFIDRHLGVRQLFSRLVPFLFYELSSALFHLWLPASGGTYQDYFKFTPQRFFGRIRDYFYVFRGIAGADVKTPAAVISTILLAGILAFAAMGLFAMLGQDFFPAAFAGVMLGMLCFYDYCSDRFVFAVYPIILLYAAYGLRFLAGRQIIQMQIVVKAIRAVLQTTVILYFTVLLVCFTVVAVQCRTGRYSLRQANSVEAEEVYAYIRENLDEGDRVYFFKPRVLYLNTDVYAYTWYNDAEHFSEADYFLKCVDDGYARAEEAVAGTAEVVFENNMFKLYALMRGENDG